MRFLCIFLFLCSHVLLISKEGPSRLTALIVYDGSESPLKSFYREDGHRMKENLKVIAKHTKLAPTIQTIKASQLSHAKLQAWIQDLSPKDTAIFYYAGKPLYGSNDQWPSLGFSCGAAPLSQTQCLRQISQKSPHLTLVLLDCYNKILPQSRRAGWKASSRRGVNKEAMNRLFVRSSGSISGCSSNSAETSVGIHQRGLRGGLFSLVIQDFFRSSTASWFDILAHVRRKCMGMTDKAQRPMMQVHLFKNDEMVQQ